MTACGGASSREWGIVVARATPENSDEIPVVIINVDISRCETNKNVLGHDDRSDANVMRKSDSRHQPTSHFEDPEALLGCTDDVVPDSTDGYDGVVMATEGPQSFLGAEFEHAHSLVPSSS